MNERVKLIIKNLGLKKHVEGGYFSETYRSPEILEGKYVYDKFNGDWNFSTAIYFMLTGQDFSAFHKLKSDEVWHFYEGSALNIYVIDKSGELRVLTLGRDIENNEEFQITIKSGQWFAAEISKRDSYSLVGCTVSPGFDFRDFELGNKEELLSLYPPHQNVIEKLTR